MIGCGTAGAASALFLARAGHRVTVFEAVDDPGPVGAGIMIQPTGMAVLARLGLLEGVLARGSRVARLHCVTAAGRDVIDLEYTDVHPRAYGLGLHRGVLFGELFDAVKREPDVELLCGHPVDGLRRVGARRTVLEADGGEHGPFDLVVVADGARSQLRDDAPLMHRERRYPWGALWFIADDPERAFDGVLHQVVDSTRAMLGLLPSGLGPTGSTPCVSMFWSLRLDSFDAWERAGLAAWKDRVAALEPRAAALLAQIQRPEDVLLASYWDIVLSPWNTDAVVYLGDAAHATSPQLGQGANLALVDAAVLVDVLADARTLREGLQAYSRAREDHLAYYQVATRLLTPFFQSDHAWLGWVRDALMGPACRLPYVRERMVRTMCGLDRGVLVADPLPMPELPRR